MITNQMNFTKKTVKICLKLNIEAVCSVFSLFVDAVVSYTQVSGVVGQPVTLLCTYSTANGAITTMCWGRGACPMSQCSDEIIRTDGTHVTFQKNIRYKLKGNLLEGNVSLTIEDAVQADSDLYCCRVEHRGWFNDMKHTISLEIKPGELVFLLPVITSWGLTELEFSVW